MSIQPRTTALLAATLIVGTPTFASAGAWPQAEGEHYTKVWVRGLVGSAGYFVDSESHPVGTYADVQLNGYGELGITPWFTIVGAAAPAGFATAQSGEDGARDSSGYMGPLFVGGRLATPQSDLPLGLRFGLELHAGYNPPVGNRTLASGTTTPEDDNPARDWQYRPTSHTGFLDAEAQTGMPLGEGWVTLSAGARWFSKSEFDPVSYGDLAGGFGLGPVDMTVHAGWYMTLGEMEVVNVSGGGETEYFSWGAGASFPLSGGLALVAALEGAALVDANAATPSLIVGFAHKSDGN